MTSTRPVTLDGEQVLAAVRIVPRGPLKYVIALIPWFLRKPMGDGATITTTRTIKQLPGGKTLSLEHSKVERVYFNTTSSAFAVVSTIDRSVWFWWLGGRGRRASLGLPFVDQPDELEKAFQSLGIEVERERLSPRRPYLR